MVHIIEPEYDTCMGLWVCDRSFTILESMGLGSQGEGIS